MLSLRHPCLLYTSGNLMYANNYDDIVVIDISNPAAPKEVNRLKNKFITRDSNKPFVWINPPVPGPAECFGYYQDSVITGWRRDSIYTCYFFWYIKTCLLYTSRCVYETVVICIVIVFFIKIFRQSLVHHVCYFLCCTTNVLRVVKETCYRTSHLSLIHI